MIDATTRARGSLLTRAALADLALLRWVARRRGPRLTAVMRVVTHTGDAAVVVLGLALALLALPGRAPAQVTLATVLALGLFSLGKRAIRRARPAEAVLPAPDRFSMPSGHATAAFAIATSVALLSPALAPLALAWALAVGVSRVVLGVHYPLDVAAGAALGVLSASLSGWFGVVPGSLSGWFGVSGWLW
ncbi:MAG: phosphatase PAP2 family protein [Deltaproteobacteria bacterium]|nr:phosphatase PAP2 family protein [Deltaproteobacteria bacterium]